MTGADIKAIRDELGLTQVQFAQLVGVHPLTVSKWERGVLAPTPHHQALIESFRRAKQRKADVGEDVGRILATAGVALALFILLKAAFDKQPNS